MVVIDGLQLTVSTVNADNCGVTCLTMNKDYTSVSGLKIYAGLDPHHYKYSITGLIPGMAYFVRVAAVNGKSVGPYGFEFYPFNPVSSTPLDVPNALSWASMSPISNYELRIYYGTPSSERPYGVNGSPTSKYHIEVATGANEIQKLQIVSTTTLQDGSFGLKFGGEITDRIDIGASALALEQSLESLNLIDDIVVNVSTETRLLVEYIITFSGPSIANKDQPLLEIDYSAICTQFLDSNIKINIDLLQDGAEDFHPKIVSLSTKADTEVSRFVELSVGFQEGKYDMVVSVGNRPAQFIVDPGSRRVKMIFMDDLPNHQRQT